MTEQEGAEKIAAAMREVRDTGLDVKVTVYGICVSDEERSWATRGASARWISSDLVVR